MRSRLKQIICFMPLLLLFSCFAADNKSAGCSAKSNKQCIRILPLGDSITQGGEAFPSYRRELWFLLHNQGLNFDFIGSQNEFEGSVDSKLKDFDLDHEGHWAWETGEILNKLADWLKDYAMWVLMMSIEARVILVLHQLRFDGVTSTISEIGLMIDLLRDNNPEVIVLVAKIIPMKNKDTAIFNQSIEKLVSLKHTTASPIVCVDQYKGYQPLVDNHDNFHPNANGEKKMALQPINHL